MPASSALPRQPISERVAGILTRLGADTLLSAKTLPAGEVIARGELILRYGITYLGRPQLAIVPDLVVADYGAMLSGEEAWNFLMERGHLYPRADVCGWRSDGESDMLRVKHLDLDYPYFVFAYSAELETQPFAIVSALIAPKPALFPDRLRAQLPVFRSLRAWQEAIA